MRNLVNLPAPCAGVTPCAALPAEVAASEVIYGPEGAAGFEGPPGDAGASGRDAFTVTASAFVMPPAGSLASVQVLDNRSFSLGQRAYIANIGYFSVDALVGTGQLNLRNLGAVSAVPAGSLVGAGLRVTSGGQPGWDVPANTPKRYAILAHMEDMGDDGGPMDVQYGSYSQGYAVIPHLEKISDPDAIAVISGDDLTRIALPIGSWKIRARVPSYYSKAFQAYLKLRTGDDLTISGGTLLATGNGYAGIDGNGQRYAVAEALAIVTEPSNWFEVHVRQESWTFARIEPLRSRALGIGSNFDDGISTPVREIFTVVEIEEL